jgi:hypothetical protein
LSPVKRKDITVRNELDNRPSNDFEPFPREALEQSIGARFEEIVRRFPSKLAVCTRNCSWTYSHLNTEADHRSGNRDQEIPAGAPVLS